MVHQPNQNPNPPTPLLSDSFKSPKARSYSPPIRLRFCSLMIRHLPVARFIGTDPDYQAMLPQCSNGVINGRFAPMKHGNHLWLRQIRIISQSSKNTNLRFCQKWESTIPGMARFITQFIARFITQFIARFITHHIDPVERNSHHNSIFPKLKGTFSVSFCDFGDSSACFLTDMKLKENF